MNKFRERKKNWYPEYPTTEEFAVELEDSELKTYMIENRAGVIITDDHLEDPACFWIDDLHVYFRINWSKWCTVSLDNPDQVAAIRNARHCRIMQIIGNASSETIVPVYHIAALPRELFRE